MSIQNSFGFNSLNKSLTLLQRWFKVCAKLFIGVSFLMGAGMGQPWLMCPNRKIRLFYALLNRSPIKTFEDDKEQFTHFMVYHLQP